MAIIKINRLFHGYASLRDYQVAEAIKNHEDIDVILNSTGEIMTILANKLSEGKTNKEKFRSKHEDNLVYSLVDFKWKPNKDNQIKLL